MYRPFDQYIETVRLFPILEDQLALFIMTQACLAGIHEPLQFLLRHILSQQALLQQRQDVSGRRMLFRLSAHIFSPFDESLLLQL